MSSKEPITMVSHNSPVVGGKCGRASNTVIMGIEKKETQTFTRKLECARAKGMEWGSYDEEVLLDSTRASSEAAGDLMP